MRSSAPRRASALPCPSPARTRRPPPPRARAPSPAGDCSACTGSSARSACARWPSSRMTRSTPPDGGHPIVDQHDVRRGAAAPLRTRPRVGHGADVDASSPRRKPTSERMTARPGRTRRDLRPLAARAALRVWSSRRRACDCRARAGHDNGAVGFSSIGTRARSLHDARLRDTIATHGARAHQRRRRDVGARIGTNDKRASSVTPLSPREQQRNRASGARTADRMSSCQRAPGPTRAGPAARTDSGASSGAMPTNPSRPGARRRLESVILHVSFLTSLDDNVG